jgi:HAD superfamily hydrolase (TIGR01549 family)
MAIIFDLDQTLVNSEAAEPYRRSRNWAQVYSMIPTLAPYPGINELLMTLKANNIPYSIVTSSPHSYCSRIVKFWGWQPDTMICYHDTPRRKPHPDPILLAISRLSIPKDSIIAIGDDPNDIIAAKRAGVLAGAALWGTRNKETLIEAGPDFLFEDVPALTRHIQNGFLQQ